MKFFNNVGLFNVLCMTSKPYKLWYENTDSITRFEDGISEVSGLVFDEGEINVCEKSIRMKYNLIRLHSFHYRNKVETIYAFELFGENIENYTFR